MVTTRSKRETRARQAMDSEGLLGCSVKVSSNSVEPADAAVSENLLTSAVLRIDVVSVTLLFGDSVPPTGADGKPLSAEEERSRYTNNGFAVWFCLDSQQSCFVELLTDGPIRQPEFAVSAADHGGLQVELYHHVPGCSRERRFLLGEAHVPASVLLRAERASEIVLEVRPLHEVPVDSQVSFAEHGADDSFGASLRLRFERFDKLARRPLSMHSVPTVVHSTSGTDAGAISYTSASEMHASSEDNCAEACSSLSVLESPCASSVTDGCQPSTPSIFLTRSGSSSRVSTVSQKAIGSRQIDFVKKLNLADSPVTVIRSIIRAASASASSHDLSSQSPLAAQSPLARSTSPCDEEAMKALAPRANTGLISLEIVGASNLPRERRLLRVHYANNPFVVVSFGKQSFRTAVVRRTVDPVWRERCFFSLRNGQAGYHVAFSVYDYKRLSYNALLGTATLRAQTLLATPNEIQKLALTLRRTTPGPGGRDAALLVKAVFITYDVMRRNFWEGLAARFDHDDDGRLNRFEVSVMLQSIGSTIAESTVDALLASVTTDAAPFAPEHDFAVDHVVSAMEELTVRSGRRVPSPSATSTTSRLSVRLRALISSLEPTEDAASACDSEPLSENIVHVAKCPICLRVFDEWDGEGPAALRADTGDADDLEVVTHLAVCAAKDQGLVDRFVMGGFLTEDYASRHWLVRLVSFLSFGGYRIGKNNGNILVQDRRTGKLLEERMPTYIRLGIRWMHQHAAAGLAVDNALVRQILQSLTAKQGRRFEEPASRRLIPGFIRFHHIDMDEVADSLESFTTFNEFFYRRLRPGARRLADASPDAVACPADCRVNVFASVSDATRLWIKGAQFTLARLLRDNQLAEYFAGGSLAVCRLAPQDYHRFHAPVDGRVLVHYTIPGAYFTVNPMAVRHGAIDVFGENRRTVVLIDAPAFGEGARIAYVAVGAMMVGSVRITAAEGEKIARLDEVGYFAFGGSTIVVLFPPPPAGRRFVFDADLAANSMQQLETLVQVGDSLGRLEDF